NLCRNLPTEEASTGSNQSLILASPTKNSTLEITDADDSVNVRSAGAPGVDAAPVLAYGRCPPPGSTGGARGEITLILKRMPQPLNIAVHGGKGGAGAKG